MGMQYDAMARCTRCSKYQQWPKKRKPQLSKMIHCRTNHRRIYGQIQGVGRQPLNQTKRKDDLDMFSPLGIANHYPLPLVTVLHY